MKEYQKLQKKIDAKNLTEPSATGKGRVPVKGTVLKVADPSKITGSMKSGMQQGVPQGFERVKKTTPEGQKIIKQKISTGELLGNKQKIEKKIVNNTKNLKNTSKPSLFKRAKDALKGFHNYMVKDSGFRRTSAKNLTRNVYKNTLRGNTLRAINKVLPGKYKALGALALTGYALTRGNKKDVDSGAGLGGGPKVYTGVNPGLKLDKVGSKKK